MDAITIFISYSRFDTVFAERIKADLRAAGATIWIDHESLQPGAPDWQAAIRRGIEAAAAVVYIGSPDAAQSVNVGSEVVIAQARRRHIYPLWAHGEHWADSAPFELIRADYFDARDDRYADAIGRLRQALRLPELMLDPTPSVTALTAQTMPIAEAEPPAQATHTDLPADSLPSSISKEPQASQTDPDTSGPSLLAPEHEPHEPLESSSEASAEVNCMVSPQPETTAEVTAAPQPAHDADPSPAPPVAVLPQPVSPNTEPSVRAHAFRVVGRMKIDTGHFLTNVAWSPDGTRLASGDLGDRVCVWDAASGRQIATWTGHEKGVTCVAWSPDGARLASDGGRKTIRIWDAVSGRLLSSYRGHSDWIYCVAWSPDSLRLASSSADKTIRLWDPQVRSGNLSNRALAVFTTDVIWTKSVTWSPDSSRLASGGYGIQIWDPVSRRRLTELDEPSEKINSVAWSPDGARLASANDESAIGLWDPSTGRLLARLKGHTSRVNSVAWSPDGSRLASGSDDKTVRVWEPISGRVLAILDGHTDKVQSVAWSPDGSHLASSGEDKTIRLWEIVEE